MSRMLRSAGVLFSFFVMMRPASAQIITTIAGNGTNGFSGDGGLATSAQLGGTIKVAIDAAGNIYFNDNNRVRKITAATGIITTIAGNGTAAYSGDAGPATSASIYFPYGVALDAANNIYITENGNYHIRKVTIAATSIVNIGWASTISVSPSPSNGSFTISANSGAGHSSERVKIEVLSPTGQRVYNNEITPATAQWSIPVRLAESVANGAYQLRISSGNSSAVHSLAVQR